MKAIGTKLVPCHFEQAIEQSGVTQTLKNCIFWEDLLNVVPQSF
jgi:hypothetical protein